MKALPAWLLAAAALLVSGCATTYQEPASGPRAQARFVTFVTGDNNTFVMAVKEGSCERSLIAQLGVAKFEHNRKKLGIPLGDSYAPEHLTEISVPAGKPFVFHVYQAMPASANRVSICEMTMTFTPQEGAQYEATYRRTPKGCVIEVDRILPEAVSYRREREKTLEKAWPPCSGIR